MLTNETHEAFCQRVPTLHFTVPTVHFRLPLWDLPAAACHGSFNVGFTPATAFPCLGVSSASSCKFRRRCAVKRAHTFRLAFRLEPAFGELAATAPR